MWFLFWLGVVVSAGWALVHFGIIAAAFALATALFAVGTAGFWVLFGVCVLAAWFLEATSWEEDRPAALALIPFALFCLVAHFISKLNLVAWMKEHWVAAATYAGWYLAVGFAFFALRWIMHFTQKRTELDLLEITFRTEHPFTGPLNEQSEAIRFRFTEFIRRSDYRVDVREVARSASYDPTVDGVWPTIGRNWRAVACWFFWWPFEIPRYVLGELWADVVKALREFFSNVFDWITKRYFGKRSQYVVDRETYEKLQANRR